MEFSIVLMQLAAIDIRIWNARFFVSTAFYLYAIIQFSELSKVKGILKGFLVTLLSYLTFVTLVLLFAVTYLYVVKGIDIFRIFTSSPQ